MFRLNVLFSFIFLTVTFVAEGGYEVSKCGRNITCILNGTVLTVRGTGNMTVDSVDPGYWYRDCEEVIIEPGCTGFSEKMFRYCRMKIITIPETVTYVPGGAFHCCWRLEHVIYLGSSDPGKNSNAFTKCWDSDPDPHPVVCVNPNYTSTQFCGVSVTPRMSKCTIILGEASLMGVILLCYSSFSSIVMILLGFGFSRSKRQTPEAEFQFPKFAFAIWFVLALYCFICGIICVAVEMDEFIFVIPETLTILIVITFLIVSFFAPEILSTRNVFKSTEEVADRLTKARDSGIIFTISVEASHEVKETVTEYYDDVSYFGGQRRVERKSRTKEKTRQVRDYFGVERFPVPYCVDLTKPVVLPSYTPFVRIRETLTIEWCHDSESKIETERKRLESKIQSMYRNSFVVATPNFNVEGSFHYALLRNTDSFLSHFIHPAVAFPLAALGFGAHFAMIVAMFSPVVNYEVRKRASLTAPVDA